MKKLILGLFVFAMLIGGLEGMKNSTFHIEDADATVKYVQGYTRSNGTSVSGHYRDTSNDGNPYNNANYLGYNN